MTAAFDAQRVSLSTLPIIDIAGLFSAVAEDRHAVALELRRACLDKGFFYVKNHRIPEPLIADVLAEVRLFFAQPMDEKLKLDKARSRANRGYERLGGQTLEAGAKPDLKEGFYIGSELPPDDPRVLAGKFNHGPNQWPTDVPGFRPVMEDYFFRLLALSHTLMRGLALALDLEEAHFDKYCHDPLATLRLLHYPPQPGPLQSGPSQSGPSQAGKHAAPELGAGAHTDFGGLTVLKQDDVGGLQVWDQGLGTWIHAAPVEGTFIVNLGDMIARWTNDRYHSTLHRVINTSGRERYSIPFFYSGNPDHEVVCIPTCLGPDEKPKYPATTVEAHLRKMYDRTYAPKPSSTSVA